MVRSAAAATAGAVVAAALLAGCTGSSAAVDAGSRLRSVRDLPILTTAPPQGTLAGRAEDRGSNSSVTGRDPGVASVFATSLPPGAVERYYQSTYRGYALSQDCCATAQRIQLVGRTGTATVGVDIDAGAAHIPDHYAIRVGAAPAGARTWVTVLVTAGR